MENSGQSQGVSIKSTPQNGNAGDIENIDQLAVNTIRFLSVDAVQKANSGHPGAPMGAAPMIYTLWDKFLRHNPRNPKWFNRDRFILSPGHASTLLYSLLHLTGYDVTLNDLKAFRQWESKTPGHPEYSLTPGVEMTTGPLGQGFATGVGMAMAERFLAEKFNRQNHEIINHFTYALVSDGDLEEGISYEAAGLAGHLKLGNLIYLYDDNDIQIEGSTDMVFSDDVKKRFESQNWHVVGPIDGNNLDEINAAIKEAQAENGMPSIIICSTNIAYGSPAKQDTASAHGEPLGIDEVIATKKNLNWPIEPTFHVPDETREHMNDAVSRGIELEQDWNKKLSAYQESFPEDYALLQDYIDCKLPEGWDSSLDSVFDSQDKPIATRAASGMVLNEFANTRVLNILGGSADLAPSNKTMIKTEGDFNDNCYSGRNIHFGVREHVMGAIVNGMSLHGGVIPYTGTFLVFSDYMKPAIRLAALMELPVIYIFTHDSIGLGEDGPTHQPIEHLTSLRSIPNLTVIRPADPHETAQAWKAAMNQKHGPTALVLTRQKVNLLQKSNGAAQGAYIVWGESDSPDGIIISTGSEVHIAIAAAEMLQKDGINIRVISMPSCEIFDSQPEDYRESILPSALRARLAIETGTAGFWRKYVGLDGDVIGIDHFGASAPSPVLYEKFGFTSENVVKRMKSLLGK
jgi:transketolase